MKATRLSIAGLLPVLAILSGCGQPKAPSVEPYLFAFGSAPTIGAAVIASGESLEIHGRGFCGEPPCPPVELSTGKGRVVETVPVASDGTFATRLAIAERPGSYFVVATQPAAGQVLQAAAPFTVVPREADGDEESST